MKTSSVVIIITFDYFHLENLSESYSFPDNTRLVLEYSLCKSGLSNNIHTKIESIRGITIVMVAGTIHL